MILTVDPHDLVQTWTDRGWLRPLDRAFVMFLGRQEKDASALVLIGAALASHQLGRGHVCLDLRAALADPDATLSLPPEGETGELMPPKPSQVLCNITQAQWEESLGASSLVGTDTAATPLVLNSGRLYLRRYWHYTRRVAEEILFRVGQTFPVPDNLENRLDKLFAPLRTPMETQKKQVHWQSIAAAVAATSAFSVISGGPGTGKTTTVVQLLGLLQGLAMEKNKVLRIRLAAPTGKAAARLTESISKAMDRLPKEIGAKMPTKVSTLHRLLGSRPDSRNFIHNRHNPLHVDLLVVDEASMIDLEMMDALLGALPSTARLILLGDKDQLASVEAGSVLGDLCANAANPCYRAETVNWIQQSTGFDVSAFSGPGSDLDQQIVVLRKSHRFGEQSGIGALARSVNQGDKKRVVDVWNQSFPDIVHLMINTCDDKGFRHLVLDGNPNAFAPKKDQDRPTGYRAFLEIMAQGPGKWESETAWLWAVLDNFNRFQVLTPLRKGSRGVEGLNTMIANILYQSGLIRSTRGWYPGRPVLVTRNDYSLGLMNGDIGIVLLVMDEHNPAIRGLRVVFPMADGSLKRVLPSRLGEVETVYAMTVHKSQGSEFDHTALVLPDTMSPVLTRELVYTGITRARSWFTMVGSHDNILSSAVGQRTHRASGLGDLIR
ncbi:exodeoxyribonuclease V subunit alpha [Desulfobacula phenolica]|uniref:DNA helicase/exodeoxyribonuclease V, alpha subunit n=1 Tax=Desulfobacula phenolica TaxID=90732 RepID=A0A1H2J378_9BACT|nr:exodeoxyribonuclease V subunit alpha [Desulfobacula phenolica]SDU50883.1 DNA helicase/exodeoxyribonuclease V, alpha subunit [Desulfobacula phenolica]